MSSIVQICNRGLSTYLGARAIVSLTEDTPEAVQCNLHYADTRKSLFEMDDWYFARGRQTLATLENDRPNEWRFKYARPTEALILRWVNDPEVARIKMAQGESPDIERETTEDAIYCDVENAVGAFTKLLVDPTLYPQYFSDALSAMTAAASAMAITEDIKRAQNAESQAAARIEHAMLKNEENTPPAETRRMPDWMKDRGIEHDAYR
jgi:hypothetical protein